MHVASETPGKTPAAADALAQSKNQNLEKHYRIVCRGAASLVRLAQRAQVQAVHQFRQNTNRRVFRYKVGNVWRKKQKLMLGNLRLFEHFHQSYLQIRN